AASTDTATHRSIRLFLATVRPFTKCPLSGCLSGCIGGISAGEAPARSVVSEDVEPQGPARVLGLEQAAALQFGDQVVGDDPVAAEVLRRDDEAVGRALLETLLDLVGDLLDRADRVPVARGRAVVVVDELAQGLVT